MINLSKYRIIDLSHELFPSEQKVDGHQRHGKPFYGERAIDLQEFFHSEDDSRMHFIQSQTHNGTHVEAPYKYSEDGKDIASIPLETYLGEAAACDFTEKAGQPITPKDFELAGVKTGDIVLAWGPPKFDKAGRWDVSSSPYLLDETIDWLIELRIKALGTENLTLSPPDKKSDEKPTSDAKLLLGGIGLIDAPTGLHQISKSRVFFIVLPVRMHRLTAAWNLAIVLEDI